MSDKKDPPQLGGETRPENSETVLQSLTVAMTQINHNYDSDSGLIPVHLLLPMEQARPGTVAEYAETLLEEPRHRRGLERHANIRSYVALFGNYTLVFGLMGATVYLAMEGKEGGAIATALLAFTQILGSLFRSQRDKQIVEVPAARSGPGKKKKYRG